MLFYISAFGLWAPPSPTGSQICARETCYLCRLECGAGVCFVWVGGILNPEVYRLEFTGCELVLVCCGALGVVVVVECAGAGELCVVVCGARAVTGADVFAGDVGAMSCDCGW